VIREKKKSEREVDPNPYRGTKKNLSGGPKRRGEKGRKKEKEETLRLRTFPEEEKAKGSQRESRDYEGKGAASGEFDLPRTGRVGVNTSRGKGLSM